MHYLSEDPWPLMAVLGLVAVGFLLALQATQDAKYLIRAGIAVALALLVFGVEWFWVTDTERIEGAVYDMARALRASDPEGVIRHLAPEVEVVEGDADLGRLDPALIRQLLPHVAFQHLMIDRLEAAAGASTRRGRATFRATAAGQNSGMLVHQGFGGVASWDLGFREVTPGEWKVTRISPTRLDPRVSNALRAYLSVGRMFGRR